MGYSIKADDNQDWDEIINEADRCMYEEKSLKKSGKANLLKFKD